MQIHISLTGLSVDFQYGHVAEEHTPRLNGSIDERQLETLFKLLNQIHNTVLRVGIVIVDDAEFESRVRLGQLSLPFGIHNEVNFALRMVVQDGRCQRYAEVLVKRIEMKIEKLLEPSLREVLFGFSLDSRVSN